MKKGSWLEILYYLIHQFHLKCGYCYSCHWKKEQIEAIELRDSLKDLYVSLSKVSHDDDDSQIPKQKQQNLEQGLEKWTTLDVLGHPAEPICNYYGCHHKFSLHGSRRCRCKHPMNHKGKQEPNDLQGIM